MRLMDATLVVGMKIDNVAEWCRVNGVNPPTFYRHRARILAEGRWRERSRRPRSSPAQTPGVVVAEVLRLRGELAPEAGADSILPELADLARARDWAAHGLRVPSRATVNRILDRAGRGWGRRTRPHDRARRGGRSGSPVRGTATRSTAPSTPSPTGPSRWPWM